MSFFVDVANSFTRIPRQQVGVGLSRQAQPYSFEFPSYARVGSQLDLARCTGTPWQALPGFLSLALLLIPIFGQVTDTAIGEQWTLLRRYRQFEALHRGLLPVLSKEPDANAYALPPKEVCVCVYAVVWIIHVCVVCCRVLV